MIKKLPKKAIKHSLGLLLFFSLNLCYVVLAHFLDTLPIENGYTGFSYILVFHLIYFFFWCFFKRLKINNIHLFFIGVLYLGSPPVFENDHYRYIWEGKVIAAGENPYRSPPNSKDLNKVKYEKRKMISYNKLTSIYPPIAQTYFLLVSPFSHKVALIIMQVFSLVMVLYLLSSFWGSSGRWTILLAPYFFKEFVQSVHIDILAVFLVLICFKYKRMFLGIILGFLTKIVILLILPFMTLQYFRNDRRHIFKPILVAVLACALLALYPVNSSNYSGAEAFVQFWFWNSLIGKPLLLIGISEYFTRLILLSSFIPIYLYLMYAYSRISLEEYVLKANIIYSSAFMGLFLISPVLHPWYLLWPLVFDTNNKYYNFFIFSSFLAYAPYGMRSLGGFAEVIQLILLSMALFNNLRCKTQLRTT